MLNSRLVDYLAIEVEETLLNVALLVPACHKSTGMGGEIRCEGSVVYDKTIIVLRTQNRGYLLQYLSV